MSERSASADAEKWFLARPESVTEARRFVTEVLADSDVDGGDAETLTAEVAANAVRHANTDFRVRIQCGPEGVRIEIVNDAPELLLIKKEPSIDGGRGLHILDRLAQDWGVESTPEEKVVWFEVERRRLDGADSPQEPRT
jgi:anti-sigma regulatory factor (Ser/Thr protein kinase)